MSTEENKAKVRRVVNEIINRGNLAIADEVMASNYVYHTPMGDVKGPEGFKQQAAMMRTAFPDINFNIDTLIAEGDMVVAIITMRGTFKGEMMGIAPTGKKISLQEAILIRFEGGKEVEATPYGDMLSFYQQLGVSPPEG